MMNIGHKGDFDEIVKPAHYTRGKIQVWDFIIDQGMSYVEGCIIKYVCRFPYKGTPVKDLKKARAYLDKLIELVEKDEAEEQKELEQENAPHLKPGGYNP